MPRALYVPLQTKQRRVSVLGEMGSDEGMGALPDEVLGAPPESTDVTEIYPTCVPKKHKFHFFFAHPATGSKMMDAHFE